MHTVWTLQRGIEVGRVFYFGCYSEVVFEVVEAIEGTELMIVQSDWLDNVKAEIQGGRRLARPSKNSNY